MVIYKVGIKGFGLGCACLNLDEVRAEVALLMAEMSIGEAIEITKHSISEKEFEDLHVID